MEASEFDKKFDDSKNVIADLDVARARRASQEKRRVDKKRQRRVNSSFANAEKPAALEEPPISDIELEQEIAAACKARH